MQNERWRKFIQSMRGYGWIAPVIIIFLSIGILAQGSWFARWGAPTAPALKPSATTVFLITATELPTVVAEPTEIHTPTAQPTHEAINGYTNPVGQYGFNYPASWLNLGEQKGAEVVFFLPGIKIEVNQQEASPGESYDQIQKDVDSYAFFHSVFLKTYMDGQEVLQEDVIDDQQALRGRYYHILKAGKYYLIGLTSDMEREQALDLSGVLPEYDQMVKSFRFTHEQAVR